MNVFDSVLKPFLVRLRNGVVYLDKLVDNETILAGGSYSNRLSLLANVHHPNSIKFLLSSGLFSWVTNSMHRKHRKEESG